MQSLEPLSAKGLEFSFRFRPVICSRGVSVDLHHLSCPVVKIIDRLCPVVPDLEDNLGIPHESFIAFLKIWILRQADVVWGHAVYHKNLIPLVFYLLWVFV